MSGKQRFNFIKRGKVREIFESENKDQLLIIATDRISAFDCILPTPIPQKGVMLTQISNYWFRLTKHIIDNHIVQEDPTNIDVDLDISDLPKRSVIVKKAEGLPIESIVRGYITGSGLKEYQKKGSICGIQLEKGLVESQKLKTPIFTPSTKAPVGQHDENISFDDVVKLIGPKLAEQVRDVSLKLYKFAANYAESVGIIIADTKFEFGILDGKLILIDELFTPDSSRFWPMDSYSPGKSQPSFDKQFVRDYLNGLNWDKTPPAPALPKDIVEKTQQKYAEAVRRLCKK
ncbi:MAG: phosphoribosylaminoimidazolesuccinocarboxamide synthase [Proteobacteria bacterium]|nr:phosphoribosylaminoimidazolesuccinocarboxamide synthase [Pseudomonadota bacterium]